MAYQYERLPWELDRPEAVALVDEGRESILDAAKLASMGGIEALEVTSLAGEACCTTRLITAGTTHLLLPHFGSDIIHILPSLLNVLAPTLVVLDLSDNGLTALPQALQQCTSLEELNISNNPLRSLPTWLSDLAGLRVLVVDRCGIQSLPQELAQLIALHTLCGRSPHMASSKLIGIARGNRMVALPAWLCLLRQLETLRVDENPFASTWQPIVAPILSSEGHPRIPTRSSSQPDEIRSPPSVSSLASSRTSTHTREAVSGVSDGWSPSSSAAVPPSGLDAIAEHASHDTLQSPMTIRPPAPTFIPLKDPSNGLRKMRSAGTLLDQGVTPPANATPLAGVRTFGTNNTASSSSVLPNRFASLSAAEGRRAASSMGNYEQDEVSPLHSSKPTGGTSKSASRWGFLRKMSMNRLKPEKASLTASASANLKLMPPTLRHMDTEPSPPTLATLSSRPGLSTARSAMTLPSRQSGSRGGLGDFGEGSIASSSTLPIGVTARSLSVSRSGSDFDGTGIAPARTKRRSFLPIDLPPSINVSIPISPFLPTAASFEHAAESDDNEDTMTSPNANADLTESHPGELDAYARYAMGLESIKSYLRDLYDLSRPRRDPFGGFEVVGGESIYAASTSASDNVTSPISGSRSSGGTTGIRSRRPTLTTQSSTASVIESEKGSSESVNADGKKFKNDPSKRVKVIREIYETERTYVRGLGELVSIYVRPADQKVNPGRSDETVIPRGESKIVFGGIEPILSIHREHLLPALEKAVRPLIEGGDDDGGTLSAQTAQTIGEVFRTYIVYMKQYSTYTNNFDNALARMQTWTTSTGATPTLPSKPKSPNTSTGVTPLSTSKISGPSSPADAIPQSGNQLTAGQKKRVKAFLKKCREHPMHSQINLESYLLLPVQRVTRYRLLVSEHVRM
jgi:hypothetical protein